ncbi:hypothetical protein GLAREA_03255 [Glarea lozoyensis ATCC 20868]|uniref:Uncharacterized protein n=1 Tax=Glarea lozoyensis (strain ATCC 20868 / MF5171) TaxID=1116229 RepID=S3CNQ2_GLAL2|nr:uncharacterized protein GLAREA_03255 [Glarea lozoyensis ATCC 20868]EPE27340.1 hypothetical protein GLAREA_03255 [Glarea lozoyensis ATCC 20868]
MSKSLMNTQQQLYQLILDSIQQQQELDDLMFLILAIRVIERESEDLSDEDDDDDGIHTIHSKTSDEDDENDEDDDNETQTTSTQTRHVNFENENVRRKLFSHPAEAEGTRKRRLSSAGEEAGRRKRRVFASQVGNVGVEDRRRRVERWVHDMAVEGSEGSTERATGKGEKVGLLKRKGESAGVPGEPQTRLSGPRRRSARIAGAGG